MKNYILTIGYLLIIILGFNLNLLAQTGSITGKVTEQDTNEPIPFVNISIMTVDGVQVAGTTTDFEGNYNTSKINVGVYNLKATMVGYDPFIKNNIKVAQNLILKVDFKLKPNIVALEEFEVVNYSVGLINKDKTSAGATVTSFSLESVTNLIPNRGSKEDSLYRSGQLTASELNDFGKWELWQDIEDKDLKYMHERWRLSPHNRYSVQDKGNGNKPIVNAVVQLINSDGSVIWKSRTDNTGKAELWTGMGSYKYEKVKSLQVQYNNESYDYHDPHKFRDGINVVILPVECTAPETVDIMFVVDATGSMDDEIRYLKGEIDNIFSFVSENNPNLSTRTASVFYCAEGEPIETFSSDFTSDQSITSAFVKAQDHTCGGEEVVDKALELAVNLNWSETSHMKLLFFVLDAPPFRNETTVARLQSATKIAAEKGIRVIPIVASAEASTMALPLEYLMRSIALATNGTYVFLTDHSKIGSSHATPVTDSYDVELLNDLLKRLISQYTYSTPCDDVAEFGVSDTTVLFAKKIIAHEVVDSTRTLASIQPDNITIDFRPAPPTGTIQDSTYSQNLPTQATGQEGTGNSINPNDSWPKNDNPDEVPGIKFFPNPTSGEITVLTTGDIKELQILDISGKLLQVVKAEKETHISLSNYSSGIYFIRFSANGASFTGKLILK